MTQADDISMIASWCDEKDIVRDFVRYKGYENHKGRLGVTYPYKDRCEIFVSIKLLDKDLCRKGVLWHEFCHAWNHVKGEGTQHDGSWWAKYLSKPQYVLLSFVAQILCMRL